MLDEMPMRDAVAWTALVIGYVRNDVSKKGLERLCEMHKIERGFQACGNLGALLEGKCFTWFSGEVQRESSRNAEKGKGFAPLFKPRSDHRFFSNFDEILVCSSPRRALRIDRSRLARMEENSGAMIKLTSANYSIWKPRMEDVLYTKDLYLPIYGDTKKPQGTSDEDWKVTNRKAVALIRTWVDQSVFHHVAQETNAYELWTKLEAMYERKMAQNKASLIRRLVNLKYKDGRSVAEHMSDFQGLINQLSTMKLVLDEELQALLLLSSLPDSWETLVVTISNSAPSGMVTMDMVKDGMFNEEARRKEQGTSVDTEALVVQNKGRSRTRNSGGDRNKSKDRSKSKSRGTSKPRSTEISGKKDTTAVASDGEVIIVCDDGFVGLTGQDLSWVIDSGASFHVTSQRDFFASYIHGDFGHVRMGNEGVSKIVGMGDVCLETNTGCKLLLKDVRHVPDIRLNLISAGKLDDEGYKNQFGDGKWKLSKGSLVVARGKKSSTLYLMQSKLSKREVNAIGDEASTELWHKRLGHMSEKGMQILARKALLPEVKVDRKLVRSNDVVFFEDQTIEDLDKNEKPTPSHEYPVNLDPIPPPIVHDDYGGDVQNDDDVEETPAAEETEQEVQQEQVLSEPPEEEQLRRSTRERQPSRRFGHFSIAEKLFDRVRDGDKGLCNTMVIEYSKVSLIKWPQKAFKLNVATLLDKLGKIFDAIKEKDAISWAVMISGYGMHGDAESAIEIFQQMKQSNARPNEVTFLAIPSACAHAGLVGEGKYFFDRMGDYALSPNLSSLGDQEICMKLKI
ncbi:hypothetical protein RHSIM_Rhsim10G0164600 [Rhododendron simsii]|uniref:GAG-pre-integrase domain-containing protein n=1 Tax=Rhododendron simsii TaxID=118357 RepID=A0A834GIG4_RHOSS|nr:hypothetical protein RHSIM_Rhsim10G0164600 [Rhododendron simsii]